MKNFLMCGVFLFSVTSHAELTKIATCLNDGGSKDGKLVAISYAAGDQISVKGLGNLKSKGYVNIYFDLDDKFKKKIINQEKVRLIQKDDFFSKRKLKIEFNKGTGFAYEKSGGICVSDFDGDIASCVRARQKLKSCKYENISI